MRDNIFTDLACEGATYQENLVSLSKNISVSRSDVANGEGECCSFYTPALWSLDTEEFDCLSWEIAKEIQAMMHHATGRGSPCSVLVAGLGNGEMTSDALGPETVKKIAVTRHLMGGVLKVGAYSSNACEVSAVIPGVLASTGIETAELLRGVALSVRPDVILAVDSLAARSPRRLARTVQLSESGISPGSGIGNHRRALNRETLGIPVIALGVPTVIHSATLIRDALEQYQDKEIDLKRLGTAKGFFVTPKETDLLIRSASALLAYAIDLACTKGQE